MSGKSREDAAKEVAAAAQEAGQKAMESVNQQHSMAHLTMDDLQANDPNAEYVKGNEKESGGWYHAPAHLEIFKAAQKRLNRLAKLRRMNVKRVTRLRAFMIKNSTTVLLVPAEDDDLAAIEMKWYGATSAWVNLITLLGPEELTLSPGVKQLFHLEYAPKDGPAGLCLMFDLSNPIATKSEPTGKSAAQTTAAATQQPAAPSTTPNDSTPNGQN
jgi:hypothetical protein